MWSNATEIDFQNGFLPSMLGGAVDLDMSPVTSATRLSSDFMCAPDVSISLPSNVVEIGRSALSNCASLTEVGRVPLCVCEAAVIADCRRD